MVGFASGNRRSATILLADDDSVVREVTASSAARPSPIPHITRPHSARASAQIACRLQRPSHHLNRNRLELARLALARRFREAACT